MGYHDKLVAEINAKLDSLTGKWAASWIAHAICNSHAEGLAENDEALFWRHCGYAEVRDEVRRCINRRAGDREDGEAGQGFLPGFRHLQSHYIVSRDGEDVGVPVYDLSDEEIEAKAAKYRGMGAACYAHADELDRFRRDRVPPPLFAEPAARASEPA